MKAKNIFTKKRIKFIIRKMISALSLFMIVMLFLLIVGIVFSFVYYKINYEEYVNSVVESMDIEDFKLEGNQEYRYSDGSTMLLYSPYQVGKLNNVDDITEVVKETLVAAEDERFYEHNGIDIKSIVRALINNLNGGSTQGASTLTQQLVKLTYLSSEKSYDRKIKEALISIELEKRMTKNEIMLLYLNRVYFANGIYGIYDASEFYFSKSYTELTYDEAASLIAIVNSPTRYDPIKNENNNKTRRDRILNKLGKSTNVVTTFNVNESYGNAYKYDKEATGAITYVKYLVENDNEFKNSEVINTTIDKDIQYQVESFVDELNDPLQAAIVVIDNSTGKVIAIDGAKTSEEDSLFSLNRAFQSPRQTGSSIKPLLDYTPIFDKYDIDTDFIVYDTGGKGIPKNSGGGHSGRIPIKKAVYKSINTIAFRLYTFMEEDGVVPLSYLEKMHFSYLDEKDYKADAVSIGGFTYGATVLEMASGYATLENRGHYRQPTALLDKDISEEIVYSPIATYLMTDCLLDVPKYGTARKLKTNNIPVACKTGTTNDYKDAWLCGYTRDYTIAIWVGADNYNENYSVKSNGEVLQLFQKVLDILPNSGEDIYTKEEIEEITSRAYTRKGDADLTLYFKKLMPYTPPVEQSVPQEVPIVPQISVTDENGNVISQEQLVP